MTEKEAAQYLAFSPGTMRRWRAEGRGLDYRRLDTGSIRYERPALDAWIDKRLSRVRAEV